LCTNQNYLVFSNELGFLRSIMIEKCIVQLSDLKDYETLDKAFRDNSKYKLLELDNATNVLDFENFYMSFINNNLKTY
jgi:hypothetical protein